MAKDSITVRKGDRKVPFLRGILTHSLMKRGIDFRQAYRAANTVREKIRDRGTITSRKLREVIRAVVEEQLGCFPPLDQRHAAPSATTVVVSADQRVPFSKGLLSQSLQASGLEPDVAYSIALEIEQSLQGSGQFEISSEKLRSLIYQTILEKHDPEFAERYLLWRRFRSPDKPLILLFGGGTGAGKTSVATEVAHRLGVNKIISTDTIRQIMRMMLARDLMPSIHASSYEAWKEYSFPEQEEWEKILTGFREQSIRVLVGVRAIIERAVRENMSLLIEGVHLVPGLMHFQDLEQQAYLLKVVVSTLDRTAYQERFPARQHHSSARPAEGYRRNFETILQIQNYILEMADSHEIPIVENQILEETVSTVLTIFTDALRERLEADPPAASGS